MAETEDKKVTDEKAGQKKAGDGGDVNFHVGRAGTGDPARNILPGTPGDFVFFLEDDVEFFRIRGTGQILVRGEVVGNDEDMPNLFRSWLETSKIVADEDATAIVISTEPSMNEAAMEEELSRHFDCVRSFCDGAPEAAASLGYIRGYVAASLLADKLNGE